MWFFSKSKNIIYKVEVFGMRCGMCEAHINDLVRRNFNVKKVKSNHRKNLVIIESVNEIGINLLKTLIQQEGYEVGEVVKE